MNQGTRNGRARFTREEVLALRARWGAYGGALRDFARREQLPYSTARNVVYGITYDSVQENAASWSTPSDRATTPTGSHQ